MGGEVQILETAELGRKPDNAPACHQTLAPPIPAPAFSLFRTGIDHLNLGEVREAAGCFDRAIELAPDFADAHIGLGIACAVDSQIYAALDHLEKAVELEPENFFAHFKLGQLHFSLRVPQKGYEEMSRALACTTSRQERRLVAHLLREERQRERNGIMRPCWNKPFSRAALLIGLGMGLVAILLLVLHLG